jgi:hypothetical protein
VVPFRVFFHPLLVSLVVGQLLSGDIHSTD